MASNSKRTLSGPDLVEQPEIKRQNINNEDMQSKIIKLIDQVLSEDIGKLVILVQEEHPYVVLQNAIAYTNMNLLMMKDSVNSENYELQINGKRYASGTFRNMQIAKKELSQAALEKLKETCFFIYKKDGYVNVTKETLQASTSSNEIRRECPVDTNSVAHKIMMKMGWTGGGLGAREQGDANTIILCKSVDRQGFGTKNLAQEITTKLTEFTESSDVLTLVFDENFTKQERLLIHTIARKFNLRSKSTGNEIRKLTISKKITKMDIVKELLKIGGEDGLYRLQIPTKYRHLWQM